MNVKEFVDKLIEETPETPKYAEIVASLEFTEKECEEEMGVTIGFLLMERLDRQIRVIKRKVGEKIVYILRLRRFGYHIEVEDEDLRKAKRKFKEKTFEIPLPQKVVELLKEDKAKIKMVA